MKRSSPGAGNTSAGTRGERPLWTICWPSWPRRSGRDLTTWAKEWLQTAGPNTLRPAVEVGPDGTFVSFAVLQEAPAQWPTLRSHRIAIGCYDRSGDALVRTQRVELDISGPRTDVPELVGRAQPALVLLNDDDLTYAALRLDEHSLSTVVSAIGRLADPLPRALCWTAAWDMVRAAELPAQGFVEMVLAGIGRESDISVVQVLQGNLITALERYVDPDHRAEATAEVTAASRAALAAAEPGGDLQLAWVRLLARVAGSDDDVAFLAGLLDGSGPVDGLAVDAELRWALLAPLVKAGRVDAAGIEAELARDRTTAGSEYAAGALATRPTPDAKAAAWASVIDRADLPNRTQDAVIGGVLSRTGLGFVQSDQADLLEPYLDRYFEVLPEVWRTRTFEIARNITTGLYPRWRAEPDTLERTDAVLARSDLPAGLRRILMEARDDVVRSIRARQADRVTVGHRSGHAVL